MVRTNLGPIRVDVNAAWDLAAHDVSIVNHWLDGLGYRGATVVPTGGALGMGLFAPARSPRQACAPSRRGGTITGALEPSYVRAN